MPIKSYRGALRLGKGELRNSKFVMTQRTHHWNDANNSCWCFQSKERLLEREEMSQPTEPVTQECSGAGLPGWLLTFIGANPPYWWAGGMPMEGYMGGGGGAGR